MASQEPIQYSQSGDCIFCEQGDENAASNLYSMMNQALAAKHASQSSTHFIMPMDIILKLQEPTSRQEAEDLAIFKEIGFIDQDEENLKRWYQDKEFQGKIEMLSEYYKFHKDIPRVIETSIEKILGKYYDRKREYDYKCIKRQLKAEQGLSITSIEQSMSQNSETIEQKSRYSTLLNALQDQPQNTHNPLMSDSNLLQEICKQIGKALPKTKIDDNDFKGIFFESEKNQFENYVKKQSRYKNNKKMFPHQELNRLKKRSKLEMKPSDNYFKLNKKDRDLENTVKVRQKGSRVRNKSINNQNSQDEKRKFIYNTNIKIQIQNAMFLPQEGHSGISKDYGGLGSNIASRKSLAGKISTLNHDRYRTPVSKIYQAQETESTAMRYKKRTASFKKEKQRLRTKESRDGDIHQKRQFSSNMLKKGSVELQKETIVPGFRDRQFNSGTVSVGRLKMQNHNNRYDPSQSRGRPPMRSGSTQSIRRRSVTINRHSSNEKTPIMKYASSEIKEQNRLKGVSINDLLTKKLNIYQR